MKFGVIKTGGKQYLVKDQEEILIDNLNLEPKAKIEFDTLATGDWDAETIEVGNPFLTKKIVGEVMENLQGDKVRVAKFKAKTRYRKVTGFRQQLTKVLISL